MSISRIPYGDVLIELDRFDFEDEDEMVDVPAVSGFEDEFLDADE